MLILLPPSEGKTAAVEGPVLDLAGLSFPGLTPARTATLSALVTLCRNRPAEASAALGLGVTQVEEVTRNAGLRRVPCGPAIEVYSGVLFEALDAGSLTTAARRRLSSRVAVSSALFGLLRPGDLIPAYRLSGDSRLPDRPSLREVWREPVQAEIAAAARGSVLLDLRSSAYADLAPPAPDDRVVTGRIMQERGGRRVAVSHHNKAAKGHLVRALMEVSRAPRTAHELRDACRAAGFRVDLEPTRGGGWVLDIVMP